MLGREKYERLHTATILFDEIKIQLTDIILKANGDVIIATDSVNKNFKWKMIFQFSWPLLIWLGFARMLSTR